MTGDADVGTKTVSGKASAAVNRVIGVIDSNNAINTSTAADYLTGVAIRSGQPRRQSPVGRRRRYLLYHAGTTAARWRSMPPTCAGSDFQRPALRQRAFRRDHLINTVGTGMPTDCPARGDVLPGFIVQTTTSHHGFVGFDPATLSPASTCSTSLMTAAPAAGGGIQRAGRLRRGVEARWDDGHRLTAGCRGSCWAILAGRRSAAGDHG